MKRKNQNQKERKKENKLIKEIHTYNDPKLSRKTVQAID